MSCSGGSPGCSRRSPPARRTGTRGTATWRPRSTTPVCRATEIASSRSSQSRDGPDQMRADAELALGALGRGPWRATALLALAEAEALSGDARAADATFEDAAETAAACGAPAAASVALAKRSLLAAAREDWPR